MSIASGMKNFGWGILGLALMVGLAVVGIGLLTGAAAFSVWVLKWTFPAFLITLLVSIVLLVPLALIPPTRAFSAVGFMIASLAFGAILWVWGMAYTYSVWGLFPVIVGLVLLGIGVVPIAMFAALIHGDWSNLGAFVVTAILTIGLRVLANWLEEKAAVRASRLRRSEPVLPAYEGGEEL